VLEQLRAIGTVVSLALIIIFIIRGCVFCIQAFPADRAGKWITVAEILSAVAWGLIGLDSLFVTSRLISAEIIGAVFWAVMACKVTSTIIKSDLGYKAVRDTYRGLHK